MRVYRDKSKDQLVQFLHEADSQQLANVLLKQDEHGNNLLHYLAMDKDNRELLFATLPAREKRVLYQQALLQQNGYRETPLYLALLRMAEYECAPPDVKDTFFISGLSLLDAENMLRVLTLERRMTFTLFTKASLISRARPTIIDLLEKYGQRAESYFLKLLKLFLFVVTNASNVELMLSCRKDFLAIIDSVKKLSNAKNSTQIYQEYSDRIRDIAFVGSYQICRRSLLINSAFVNADFFRKSLTYLQDFLLSRQDFDCLTGLEKQLAKEVADHHVFADDDSLYVTPNESLRSFSLAEESKDEWIGNFKELPSELLVEKIDSIDPLGESFLHNLFRCSVESFPALLNRMQADNDLRNQVVEHITRETSPGTMPLSLLVKLDHGVWFFDFCKVMPLPQLVMILLYKGGEEYCVLDQLLRVALEHDNLKAAFFMLLVVWLNALEKAPKGQEDFYINLQMFLHAIDAIECSQAMSTQHLSSLQYSIPALSSDRTFVGVRRELLTALERTIRAPSHAKVLFDAIVVLREYMQYRLTHWESGDLCQIRFYEKLLHDYTFRPLPGYSC